jgi:hypothetical protein
MMFSLALAASRGDPLPPAREDTDDGVEGRAEAVEDGVAGRAEDDGVVGRAKAAERVAGRPPDDEDGVVGRADDEEGVDGRPPDEVLDGGGGAAAAGAGRRDRNGDILERDDLDNDIAAPPRWSGAGFWRGLGFWRERGEHEHEIVGVEGGARGLCFEGRRRLPPRRPGAAFFGVFGLKL